MAAISSYGCCNGNIRSILSCTNKMDLYGGIVQQTTQIVHKIFHIRERCNFSQSLVSLLFAALFSAGTHTCDNNSQTDHDNHNHNSDNNTNDNRNESSLSLQWLRYRDL